jgi:hypothetical protein
MSGGNLNPPILAAAIAAALAVSLTAALAQDLPGDHVIVPGVRIGAAELAPADQGAVVRDLGEPAQTVRNGDREYYFYGPVAPDGAQPSELVIGFDLVKDAPFEISTASPTYRTPDGLGVGSSEMAIRARLGQPVCHRDDGKGGGVIAYGAIWFLIARGAVTKVSIRTHVSPDDFRTIPCR